MNTQSERYRWARQPTVRAHLRDLEKLAAWEAATAGARKEAAPPPPPAPPARKPPIPRETLARERRKLEYLWEAWCAEAAEAVRLGMTIPTLEEVARLVDCEGWGE